MSEKFVDLTTEAYTNLLKGAPVYAKFGKVTARAATVEEKVVTKLGNGKEETVNTAHPGDIIVTNPTGEEYVIDAAKFAKRYEATDDLGVYRAKGCARAVKNPEGCDIKIMAPWGEEQKGDENCMVATLYDPANPDEIGTDRYIIGGEEFAATYAPYADVFGE